MRREKLEGNRSQLQINEKALREAEEGDGVGKRNRVEIEERTGEEDGEDDGCCDRGGEGRWRLAEKLSRIQGWAYGGL
jgi:hypothetical protein